MNSERGSSFCISTIAVSERTLQSACGEIVKLDGEEEQGYIARMPEVSTEPAVVDIFGVPFVVSDLEAASEYFARVAVETPEAVPVAHADAHVLTRILHDEEYGRGMAEFRYICPDGMPIVWLMRRKGTAANRLYGPDVMEWVWNKGREVGVKHFLLGGTEEAVSLLTENLSRRFPGVQVAGSYCPPMGVWPDGTNEEIFRRIRESGARCVWVGLGCPKQERWLFENRQQLPPAVYFGVGAAFNFHAGLVKQAPAWVRNHGFEWLWRLCREPRRLFRRYLVHNTRFIWYCLTRRI